MRRRRGALGAVAVAVIAALAACSGGRAAEPAPAAPAPTTPASAGSASAAPAAPAPAAPALPPIELACTADRDCALTDLQLDGPSTCCQGCDVAHAGRADWVARLRAACAARPDLTAGCLPLNCPVGAQRAVCRDGRCAVAL